MKKLMLLLAVLMLAVTPVFGAASETAGEVLGFMAPTSGQTVRLPVMLLDSAGAVVTGEAFNAAGMTVMYAKDGGSSFQAFPTWDTNNWDEIGYGLYMVIIREADGTELALLDTIGHFYINVNTTAARGDTFTYKINVADVARDDQWTDTRAGYVDASISSRSTLAAGAEMDLVDAPNATAILAIQSGLSTLAAGAQMDLVDAPNGTAITAIQSGLSTLSAGAQMDLVDAPNSTAIAAITSGLSTVTTAQVNAECDSALSDYDAALPGEAMDLVANALDASAVAGTGAGEIASAVAAGGAGITTYYAQVQRNERTAIRRTVYFYATGTLPGKASISTNGGAFGNSDNTPATINGSRRKLEISRAELADRGRLLIDITTTVTAQTAIIIVDVVDFDPFTEGSVTTVGRRLRAAGAGG